MEKDCYAIAKNPRLFCRKDLIQFEKTLIQECRVKVTCTVVTQDSTQDSNEIQYSFPFNVSRFKRSWLFIIFKCFFRETSMRSGESVDKE